MARISEMTQKEPKRTKVHDEVEATYSVFEDTNGDVYLQIDTYGSKGRAVPGKTSQSVQFGPAGLAALKSVLGNIR